MAIARSRGHVKLAECLEQLQREEQAQLRQNPRIPSPASEEPSGENWLTHWQSEIVASQKPPKGVAIISNSNTGTGHPCFEKAFSSRNILGLQIQYYCIIFTIPSSGSKNCQHTEKDFMTLWGSSQMRTKVFVGTPCVCVCVKRALEFFKCILRVHLLGSCLPFSRFNCYCAERTQGHHCLVVVEGWPSERHHPADAQLLLPHARSSLPSLPLTGTMEKASHLFSELFGPKPPFFPVPVSQGWAWYAGCHFGWPAPQTVSCNCQLV